MNSMHTLKELSSGLSLLFVEDEEHIRTVVLSILELFFGNIYVACNGSEGLQKFKEKKIDLVIADIRMPVMDGLTMVEKIREIEPTMPVIITTSFNDEEYFLKSIDLKVDKYLLKPIKKELVIDTLLNVTQMIHDRVKAKEYELKMLEEKINKISSDLISKIVDSYQSPCIIYNEGRLSFVNSTFCKLFEDSLIKEFLEGKIGTQELFDQRDDFLPSLEAFNEEDLQNNNVSISKQRGRKIYRVIKKEIELSEGEVSYMYIFNDITLEEYQKIKIKAYSERLEEIVVTSYYKKSKHISKTDEQTPVEEQDETKQKEKLVIVDEDRALLRRSHIYKTAAVEYVAELDDEILTELQELDELDKDFSESIITFEEKQSNDALQQMASELEKYAHNISMLFEFEDLAYAIRSLSTLLKSINVESIDANRLKKIQIFLSGIQEDLYNWRKMIFIEQSAIDIHYLDSALFSACLQMELVLNDSVEEMESEEDDLILF